MASLSETPAMRQARETAFRDKSLLNKQYRQARASGDFGRAMTVAQQADKMGMPVGVTGSFDQLAQTGQRRYEQSMFAAGQQPEKTGLAGFDFRQASQRGAVGVGGYDFRQKAQQQPMQPAQDMAPQTPSGQRVPPVALSTTVPGGAPATPANPRAGLREQFTRMYQEAQDDTPESEQAQADIVAEAYAQGVPLSGLGMDILRKSQAGILAQPAQATSPAPSVAAPGKMVEVSPSGYTVATDEGKKYMKSREEMFMKDPAFVRARQERAAAAKQRDEQFAAEQYSRTQANQSSMIESEKGRQAELDAFDAEMKRKQGEQADTLYNLEQGQVDTGNRMKAISQEEKANDRSFLGRMPQQTERMYLNMMRQSARKKMQNQGRLTLR